VQLRVLFGSLGNRATRSVPDMTKTLAVCSSRGCRTARPRRIAGRAVRNSVGVGIDTWNQ
jgi:hypothetical protein